MAGIRLAGPADATDLAPSADRGGLGAPEVRARLAALADAADSDLSADRRGLGVPPARRLAAAADSAAGARLTGPAHRTGAPDLARIRSARAQAAPVRLTRLGRVLLGLVAALVVLSVIATAASLAVRHGRPAPPLPASAPAVVVVQPGDTLWQIARRFAPQRDPRDVVTELRRLNALPSADVRAGQQLRLRRP